MYTDLKSFLQTAPLFRVFIMLTAGVLSGEFIFDSISPVIVIAVSAIVMAASFLVRRSGTVQSVMLMFAVFLAGLGAHRVSASRMHVMENGIYDYNAVVTSSVKHKDDFSTFDLLITDYGSYEKIKATVRGTADYYPGDRLHVSSRIKMPDEKEIRRFSYSDYLRRNGYAGTTFIDRNDIDFEGNFCDDLPIYIRVRTALLQMRSSMLAHLHDEGLSGRDFAAVSAMAFGDKTYLSAGDREIYSRTGVSHVLALSGLHIGIIYAFLAFFMTFIPKVPKFMAIQTAIWFYVVFAGMSPSLIRAALMITVYSAGALMHRDKLSLNTLSLAGTVSVLVSPQIIFDLCFQLSFMSVFSILLFYRPVASLLPSRPAIIKKIMQMTAVSVAAYIGTLPIILYNFGSMSYSFIITNLVVIPLTTIVVYLAILSFLPLAGTYIAGALALTIHTLNTFVNAVSRISFLSVQDRHISLITLLLTYVAIFSIYLIYCKLATSKNISND